MSKPRTIGVRIDIESRSRTDIKNGAYRYCEDPDFKVLIIGYTPIRQYAGGAIKLGRVRTLDLGHGTAAYTEQAQFRKIIQDPRFQKHAFNANFERIALSKWLGLPNGTFIDPENWRCSAVLANVNGVFGTLDEVARAVRSPIKKDTEGKRLIRLFSIPDKKTGQFHELSSKVGQWVIPKCWCGADHNADFKAFETYCEQDVITEAVTASAFPEIPTPVQAEYEADQRINDRGIRHFSGLAKQAVRQVEEYKNEVMAELKALTGLDNPNSNPQMMGWLTAQGYPMASLDKAHRAEALADPLIPDEVAEALKLKGMASLSSVTKHKAALASRCADGRIRGSLRFYGAHTGREAGRGIQPQNLPRYEAPDAERKAMLMGVLHAIVGADPALVAKGTVRASLVPAKGHVFVTADYNAIEARVLAGLCGETWAQAEFAGAGKIYEATAATMFGVDKARLIADLKACDKCGKTTCAACVTRGKGKVSNLALGYGGGAGALVTMGAEEAGIDCGNYRELNAEWKALGMPGGKFHEWNRDAHDYPELLRIRDLYREASPMTTRFWKLCAKAWDIAALSGRGAQFGNGQVLTMLRDGKHNRLVLPSGRSIWYRFAAAHADKDRPDRVDRRTFIGKSAGVGHYRTDTHGGKLTENVTQAVARDVLFDLLMKIEALTARGWPARTVLHVHDEVVLEVPTKHADQVLADTIGLMSTPPEWGQFLVVKGEGNIMERYGK
jgi:DNA polymerase bacteriophage-type